MSAVTSTVRLAAVTAAGLGLSLTSGCTSLRYHQGYIADAALVASVRPGVDNRDSVAQVLGRPSFVGQFDQSDWYYVSRQTRQLAFSSPKPIEQMVMRVHFDPQGNVADIQRTGLETVVKINPEGDKTPTLGRNESFFQDIFGNIGSVGGTGTGSGQSNDPTKP